jgi:hypothetical protein
VFAYPGIQSIDRGIGKMQWATQTNRYRKAEDERRPQAERRDEARLPDIGPSGMRDDIEKQRWKTTNRFNSADAVGPSRLRRRASQPAKNGENG